MGPGSNREDADRKKKRVSWARLRDLIQGMGVGPSSRTVDLKGILDRMEKEEGPMDGNEAVLRFLYELSREG